MSDLIPKDKKQAEQLPPDGPLIELGQWYWIDDNDDKGILRKKSFFACVTKIGSNFIECHNPFGSYTRIHLDKLLDECRLEPEPEKIIREQMMKYRREVQEKLGEIKNIMARLGLTELPKLGHNAQPQETSKALSVIAASEDVNQYKKKLIEAKEKDLPALFEEVKEANEKLATWMQAQALPMEAASEELEERLGQIDDRIFNVSLYAGLTEDVKQVSDGKPADSTDRLHILQRLLYMDEECLLDYKHGGMEFSNIKKFDAWLAKPGNRDRVLPFPRSIVAFRVRRDEKERDYDGSLAQAMIIFDLKELDKLTFLYIRNGERLYRMNCDLEFGNLIFPGQHELNLSEPMMAKMFCSRVNEIIPKREFEDLVVREKERVVKEKEWRKVNPGKSWIENPFHEWSDKTRDFEPFDKTSVYFDEMSAEVAKRIKQYNRIAVIVQGLFDRSEVLHPHPPVQLWSPGGFAAAVELVYDGSNTLHYGDAPDFEAYRLECNKTLKEGSIVVGQHGYWLNKEVEREQNRQENNWRYKNPHVSAAWYKPPGNPGPGYVAKVAYWFPKKRLAVFRWMRERQAFGRYNDGELIPTSVAVPDTHLFNVSAYKPGDYKQFFIDPRTRAQYLKWARMLLAAEDYFSGHIKVGEAPE